MTNRLTPAQTVRLLRAKAAELENHFAGRMQTSSPGDSEVLWCIADLALIAGILADHLEDFADPDSGEPLRVPLAIRDEPS